MSVYLKIKKAQMAIFYEKARKEALKLSFAVVVAECVMVVALHYGVKWGIYEYFQPKNIIIYTSKPAEAKEIQIEKVETKDNTDELADLIWLNESTRGKNNYSKCEAIGQINGIGYGIPGSGKYQCFDSHQEEMQILNKWIKDHKDQGMTDKELLCHYSGNNYNQCK